MADFTSWTAKTVRKYFAVPSPTNLTEVSKVIQAIKNDLDSKSIEYYDDTVLVEAWDDQIRFSFVMKDGTND